MHDSYLGVVHDGANAGYAGWDDTFSNTQLEQSHEEDADGDAVPYATVTPEEVHDRVRRIALLAATNGWAGELRSVSRPTADPPLDQTGHQHQHQTHSDDVDDSDMLLVTDAAGRVLDHVDVVASKRRLSFGGVRRKAKAGANADRVKEATSDTDSKGSNRSGGNRRSSSVSSGPSKSTTSPTSPVPSTPHCSDNHTPIKRTITSGSIVESGTPRGIRPGKEHRRADGQSRAHVEVDMTADATSPYNTTAFATAASEVIYRFVVPS